MKDKLGKGEYRMETKNGATIMTRKTVPIYAYSHHHLPSGARPVPRKGSVSGKQAIREYNEWNFHYAGWNVSIYNKQHNHSVAHTQFREIATESAN